MKVWPLDGGKVAARWRTAAADVLVVLTIVKVDPAVLSAYAFRIQEIFDPE